MLSILLFILYIIIIIIIIIYVTYYYLYFLVSSKRFLHISAARKKKNKIVKISFHNWENKMKNCAVA